MVIARLQVFVVKLYIWNYRLEPVIVYFVATGVGKIWFNFVIVISTCVSELSQPIPPSQSYYTHT